jgi:hypothetical protein
MNLKLVVAISALTVMPALGHAPTDAPKPTTADVERVIQTISGDKTKMQTYCDLAKLNQQIVQAGETKDAGTLQTLGQKLDDLTQKLGPDYIKLIDGLEQVDEDSNEGKDVSASFDEIADALSALDKRCK